MRLATTPFPRKAADTTRKPTAEKIRTAATSRQRSRHNHPRRPRRCPSTRRSFSLSRRLPCKRPSLPTAMTVSTPRILFLPASRCLPKTTAARQPRLHPRTKIPSAVSRSVTDLRIRGHRLSSPRWVTVRIPSAQNPAPIQVSATAGDDGTDVANGSSSNGTVTGKDNGPAVRNKIGDGKPAANNSIGNKTAGKQPIDPNAASQIMPAMDDDAEPAAQNGIGAPPPVNSTDQTALATGGDARALARMANAGASPGSRARRQGYGTSRQARPGRLQCRHRPAADCHAGTTRPRHHQGWQKPATGRQPHTGGSERQYRRQAGTRVRCDAATGRAFACCPCRDAGERPAAGPDDDQPRPAQTFRTAPPTRW